MSQNPGIPLEPQLAPNVTACSNCHMPMPSELRFCRNCGYRLGEGLAEYNETVRFQNGNMPAAARATAGQPLTTSYGLSGNMPVEAGKSCLARKRKITGMTWIFLGLLSFFLVAGVFTALFAPRRSFNMGGVVVATTPRSFFGVDGFDSTDGGVTFDDVEPPDSPADRAGLIGGDIITSYDGQAVEDEDAMSDLLAKTPVGKTVDVVYLRDGESKTTKLTTISKDEGRKLEGLFAKRPEGMGYVGIDRMSRVEVEGVKTFGAQIGEVRVSRPADLAGIKAGDIVVQYGETPIRTPGELRARIRRTLPYSTVDVILYRGAEKLKIALKVAKEP
jgi:membrane-associated protease RseP (regulator of RpoE activity)